MSNMPHFCDYAMMSPIQYEGILIPFTNIHFPHGKLPTNNEALVWQLNRRNV